MWEKREGKAKERNHTSRSRIVLARYGRKSVDFRKRKTTLVDFCVHRCMISMGQSQTIATYVLTYLERCGMRDTSTRSQFWFNFICGCDRYVCSECSQNDLSSKCSSPSGWPDLPNFRRLGRRLLFKVFQLPQWPTNLGHFFRGKRCEFIWTKNGLGYFLGHFFTS
jgi:hypothetical protein